MKNRILVILLTLLVFPRFGQAQWVQTNGPTAGNIHTLALIGNNLFAGTDSGVYYTTDEGISWSGAGLQKNIIFSLAESGPNLFAGTSDSGVFISTNGGKSWTLTDEHLIDPYISAITVVGTSIFVGTEYTGIVRSTDEGKSWSAANSPGLDESVFAALGTNIFASDYYGNVVRSTNSGTSWVAADTGLPRGEAILALASEGTNLFAGTSGDGVFFSTNMGTSWEEASIGLEGKTIRALEVVGTNIFAGASEGTVLLSIDSGADWTNESAGLSFPPYSINSFSHNDTTLFIGTDAGVWRRPLSEFISSGVASIQQTSSLQIQNYPNPFSQSTTISFTSPESGTAEVSVVNILGAEVMRIFSGSLDAGEHSFSWDASTLPPGMYECVVSVNGNVQRIPLSHLR